MTERKAWFCPSCQKHHAPHCDSCPNPTVEVRPLPGVNVWPAPTTAVPQPTIDPYWTAIGSGAYNPAFDPDRLVICINGAH